MWTSFFFSISKASNDKGNILKAFMIRIKKRNFFPPCLKKVEIQYERQLLNNSGIQREDAP